MDVGWVDAGNPTPSGVSLGLLGFATQPTIASISAYFSAIHCRVRISVGEVYFSEMPQVLHKAPLQFFILRSIRTVRGVGGASLVGIRTLKRFGFNR